MASLVLPEHF
jgi:hypothetical protein